MNLPLARETAIRICESGENASCRFDETMRLLDMDAAQAAICLDMASDLTFLTPNRRMLSDWIQKVSLRRETLWKYGISGDHPILAADIPQDAVASEKLAVLIQSYLFLFLNGGYCDLVLLTDDGGDYSRPMASFLAECLDRYDCEDLLDVRCGVHILDKSALSEAERTAILALSDVLYDVQKGYQAYPRVWHSVEMPAKRHHRTVAVPEVGFRADNVTFTTKNGLPPLAWSHILANRTFGWLATDCGVGHLWHLNARERMLDRWVNDPLTDHGPEQIRVYLWRA